MMSNFCIDIINEQELIKLNNENIENSAQTLINSLISDQDFIKKTTLKDLNIKEKTFYLDVLLCDDEKIHTLNKQKNTTKHF